MSLNKGIDSNDWASPDSQKHKTLDASVLEGESRVKITGLRDDKERNTRVYTLSE